MSQNRNLMQVASRKELFDICRFLEGHLPQTCYIYQSLVAGMLAPSDTWRFYFKRGSNGNYEATVSTIREKYFDSTLHTFESRWLISSWMEDETCLLQTLEEIKEIDWFKAKWEIYGLRKTHFQPWIKNHGIEILYDPTVSYVLPISKALSIQIGIPDDVYVKSLERKHAGIVYDHWSHNFSTLVEYVADEIDWFPSAGVFLKDGDVLVTWVMSHPPTGMGRLHTLEPYRRRGYAALAIRYLAKRMAQSGFFPFAYALTTNESSKRLFELLGFTVLGQLVDAYTPL